MTSTGCACLEGRPAGWGQSRGGASVTALLPPQGYLSYIKSLPLNDMPEIFGLHDNANITFAQNETYTLLGTIVQLQPKSSSAGGKSREEVSGSREGAHPMQDQSPVHHPAYSTE